MGPALTAPPKPSSFIIKLVPPAVKWEMQGAGYVLGTWLPLHHHKPGASCNNHKYLQLAYFETQRRKENPCCSPTSPPSETSTDNQEYLSVRPATNGSCDSEHTSFGNSGVFGEYITPQQAPPYLFTQQAHLIRSLLRRPWL